MSHSQQELNAAASKNLPLKRVKTFLGFNLPLHLEGDSRVAKSLNGHFAPESLLDSFNGDTGSLNAYHAKKEKNAQPLAKKVKGKKRQKRRKFVEDISGSRSYDWHTNKMLGKVKDQQRESRVTAKFEPHAGLEALSASNIAFETFAKFAGVDVPDVILREVEGILLLVTNLTQQTTILGVSSAIMLHIRAYTDKSIIKQVGEYITDIFSCDLEPETTELDEQSGPETPDWLSCLRNVRQNWQMCKTNKAFSQISKLIGCFVVMGLCEATDMTFNLGKFKVFTPHLFEKHCTALDLADAMFETVLFFAEGMYLCFKTRSIRPLLINDHSALELDEEFAKIQSWWDLVKVGNLKKFKDISDQEFERRLNELTTSLKNLTCTLKGLDKKLVMDKYTKCLKMQNDFVTMKISSGVRHSPFAIELFGESSQGKTTLGDQLVDALLLSANLPTEKNYRVAYNAGDKYMSNWTSEKLVLLFDDCSNEKSQFVERPPTRAILDVCNNQMYYANKAELEAKGKCFVEPWIAMATTNKKDLDAGLYSNCPYSIQRRMTCYTVEVKPQYRKIVDGINCGIDSAKVREANTVEGVYSPPAFDDIWLITIEQAVKPSNMSSTATYRPVVWRGKELIQVDMKTCMQYSIEAFHEHRKNQFALLDGMKQRQCRVVKCSHEGCIFIKGCCPDHMDDQFGKETLGACQRMFTLGKTNLMFSEKKYGDRLDKRAALLIYKEGTKAIKKFSWIKLVPEQYVDTVWTRLLMQFIHEDEIEKAVHKRVYTLWTMFLGVTYLMTYVLSTGTAIFFTFFYFLYTYGTHQGLIGKVEDELFEKLKEKNGMITPIVKKYRDECAKYVCGAFVGLAALYGLAKAYKAWKAKNPQGSLEPTTAEEVKQRDSEVNVWAGVTTRSLPISDKSKTVSADQLEDKVSKNMVYGTVHLDDKDNGRLNGLFLQSNVLLIPDHYFTEFGDVLNCTFRKDKPDKCGGKFVAAIAKSASIKIPDMDLRVCYCSSGGSFADITNHLPLSVKMPAVPFRLQWRQKDGSMVKAKGLTVPGMVETTSSFYGGEYKNLTINTFNGLCGGTLVSETQGSVLFGIHLGGIADTPRGGFGGISQVEIQESIEKLRKLEGVIVSGSAGAFTTQILGKEIMTHQDVHNKSPLNYMPENSQFEYYGSCIGRAVSKSSVKVTPISETLTDVCGVPNIYGPPKMNPEWYGWQTCLANAAIPAHPYPHDLLAIAIKDYKEDLTPIFQHPLWVGTTPLTDKQNLNGIPGMKFVDAIKMNTSIGFPLTGAKRKFVTETNHEDGSVEREFDPAIMADINRCENLYKQGKRAYPIAKACKKDEILAKEKCRIFYGNAISLTWLVRKYFLPILRILQMNPMKSECAVGVNSHGPEWDEMYRHMIKFGKNRLFGGDYGKYDQKLPSQLIFAALRILIDFARNCDYSEEDLKIMEAMTGDIVYAVIAYNGDLIGLTEGTHISGNSLTVIINGICGSLNLRCYYYSEHPVKDFQTRRPFRDYVSAMTYGDDNIGSVSVHEDKFTIKGISEFLAKYGQVYTMPDKESELLEFLPEEEFEFLKRKSIYHPQLGVHVGALLDKSIFKSLHCFMRPKGCVNTEEFAVAQNIDGALREWFNHGEGVFEMRRKQMIEVANRTNIRHLCTGLDVDYPARVNAWKEKYNEVDSMGQPIQNVLLRIDHE